MALRTTALRERTDRARRTRAGDEIRRQAAGPIPFGERVLRVLAGRGAVEAASELDGLALVDLLEPTPTAAPVHGRLRELLDLAFLGRVSAGEIDVELDALEVAASSWTAAQFAADLFLPDLVRGCFSGLPQGASSPAHRRFLERVLASPPAESARLRHRQGVLGELEVRPELAARLAALLVSIQDLMALLRASRDDARLEPVRFRLDVLRSLRLVVTAMVEGFADARSGLVRLAEAGREIRAAAAFQRMEALLDHRSGMASLELAVRLGADGRLRSVEVIRLRENRRNPFYHGPLRRWFDRLRTSWRGYRLHREELVDRLVMGVYQGVAPALVRVVQLCCHLEVYVAARGFAAAARERGLEVCLPDLVAGARPVVEGLFNPLLLALVEQPVATDIAAPDRSPIVLVTGPNSGGKTRLLQAVGLCQVLAQSGLYAPCRRAVLPVVPGLYASIVELDRADQAEGRLGTELVRLRTLFESAPPGSLVLLDELCSGTNPSEAVEIIILVLRLLRRLEPVAFVTTHFLDFALELESCSPVEGLSFLRAEVDPDGGTTYQFVPGVATTSLAVGTARRLGVTFEELERRLEARIAGAEPQSPSQGNQA